MALLDLFRSFRGPLVRPADAANSEGAPAYALTPEHELAQLVSTGCLAGTFYATAGEQLEQMLALAGRVAPEFVAKAAVVARARGRMKDAPALLVATLATRAPALFAAVFPHVIDDGRLLRTFVQIVRSGVTGRKSLGTLPRRLVRGWLEARSDEAVLRASVGTSPSLADVIRMVHPAPATPSRSALYAWLLDRPHDAAALPELAAVRGVEGRPTTSRRPVPPALRPASAAAWASIARRASWQTTRMNLATFARHGASRRSRLAGGRRAPADRDEVLAPASSVQLLAATGRATRRSQPRSRTLHTASRSPSRTCPRSTAASPWTCRSMRSPVTGARGSGSTSITCLDVAACSRRSCARTRAPR
jgi:60 kDa SS-A/Ro ribonucleoprotein